MIYDLCNSEELVARKEREFEQMVAWVTMASQKISQIMSESKLAGNPYSKVKFAPIVSSLLYLLDA